MEQNERKSFNLAVIEIINLIPLGRVTSYKALAKAAGYPNMSRLVGRIVSNSDSLIKNIPAHRVVNSQGQLSGKKAFGNGTEMQQLLESEGIGIKNDRIENWKTVFWNPIEEIK